MRTEELPVERAVAEAVRRGADRGVRVVDYASGCRKQPDTVMRRHIVTMTKQASVDRALDICRRAGVALVEVGSHRRPSHREWQGRVYGLDGPVTIEGVHYKGFEESGAADGLMEPNCGHSVAPYIPGRERRWSETPDEDAGDDPEEAYKRRQRQRANERRIRDAKREVAALEAEGLDSARARIRLQRAETAQRNLLADRRTRRRVGREEAYDASGRRINVKGTTARAIRERDERVNGPLPNTIFKGRQDKHIRGTHAFEREVENRVANGSEYASPSWIDPSLTYEDLQRLVDEHAGRGIPVATSSGEWTKKEICRSDRVIGYNVTKDGVEETDTFTIHYSKDGTHIVPASPSEALNGS